MKKINKKPRWRNQIRGYSNLLYAYLWVGKNHFETYVCMYGQLMNTMKKHRYNCFYIFLLYIHAKHYVFQRLIWGSQCVCVRRSMDRSINRHFSFLFRRSIDFLMVSFPFLAHKCLCFRSAFSFLPVSAKKTFTRFHFYNIYTFSLLFSASGACRAAISIARAAGSLGYSTLLFNALKSSRSSVLLFSKSRNQFLHIFLFSLSRQMKIFSVLYSLFFQSCGF